MMVSMGLVLGERELLVILRVCSSNGELLVSFPVIFNGALVGGGSGIGALWGWYFQARMW